MEPQIFYVLWPIMAAWFSRVLFSPDVPMCFSGTPGQQVPPPKKHAYVDRASFCSGVPGVVLIASKYQKTVMVVVVARDPGPQEFYTSETLRGAIGHLVTSKPGYNPLNGDL